jgi:hypothetical protein
MSVCAIASFGFAAPASADDRNLLCITLPGQEFAENCTAVDLLGIDYPTLVDNVIGVLENPGPVCDLLGGPSAPLAGGYGLVICKPYIYYDVDTGVVGLESSDGDLLGVEVIEQDMFYEGQNCHFAGVEVDLAGGVGGTFTDQINISAAHCEDPA